MVNADVWNNPISLSELGIKHMIDGLGQYYFTLKKAGITNEKIVTRKTDSLNSDE